MFVWNPYLKKVQNDICPDINMEEEKKKYTLRILTKKLYDSNLINPKTDPNMKPKIEDDIPQIDITPPNCIFFTFNNMV